MKFLCVECDRVMDFRDRHLPGDGTLAAVFRCGSCGRETGLLTNPMETQLVSSLGVRIGGREVPEQPMELTRSSLRDGREEAFSEGGEGRGGESEGAGSAADIGSAADPPDVEGSPAPEAAGTDSGPLRVEWTPEAVDRLGRVPSFVRGMVKRIYTDWARERRIATITPETMDRARTELGLEGM